MTDEDFEKGSRTAEEKMDDGICPFCRTPMNIEKQGQCHHCGWCNTRFKVDIAAFIKKDNEEQAEAYALTQYQTLVIEPDYSFLNDPKPALIPQFIWNMRNNSKKASAKEAAEIATERERQRWYAGTAEGKAEIAAQEEADRKQAEWEASPAGQAARQRAEYERNMRYSQYQIAKQTYDLQTAIIGKRPDGTINWFQARQTLGAPPEWLG